MATPALPQVMARQLIARMANQPSPMGQAAPAAINSGGAGDQVAQQAAQLQGADPDFIMKALSQVKSIVVNLYPRAAFTMPGVARNLAQSQKYIDNAIAEAEKAAATAQAVNPIANNAAIPNPGLQDFASGGGA